MVCGVMTTQTKSWTERNTFTPMMLKNVAFYPEEKGFVPASKVRELEELKNKLEEAGHAIVDETNAVGSVSNGTMDKLSEVLQIAKEFNTHE